ncbi:MAG: LuxR C-terminal-related transcriptional regulator [Nocardioides sp.]
MHPVIREATLAALGPLQVAAMHGRAVAELYGRQAPARQLAPHLLAAPIGTLPDAADVLSQAAAESQVAGDAAVAIACLRRSLVERPGEAPIRARLGSMLLRQGLPGEAREHLVAAAEAVDDVHRRAELLSLAAAALGQLKGADAAVAELQEHVAGWPAELPAERLVLESALGVYRSFLPEHRRAASNHLSRFGGLAGVTREERTLLALLAQRGRYEAEPHDEVADIALRALGSGALFDDGLSGGGGLVGWVLAMMSLISADRIAEATGEIDRTRLRVRAAGSPLDFAIIDSAAGFLAWRVGDVAGAEASAEASVAAISYDDITPQVASMRATAAHFAAHGALERGDPAGAQAAIDAFDATAPDTHVIPVIWLHEARAMTSLALGDPAAALEHAMRQRTAMQDADLDPAILSWRLPAALASIRLGQSAAAQQYAEDHLVVARRWGSPVDLGTALRVSARVSGSAGEQLTLHEEAEALLATGVGRLEHARALVDLGEAQRVAGRRTDARERLLLGAELARTCGSLVLERRAAEVLEALGDRPRRLMAPGLDSLTASERRVAGLAVDGRSNRDIAQELFVSPKTVENHLGRVYTKLGIANRRELAGALG